MSMTQITFLLNGEKVMMVTGYTAEGEQTLYELISQNSRGIFSDKQTHPEFENIMYIAGQTLETKVGSFTP